MAELSAVLYWIQLILRYVVSIPLGHPQWEADSIREEDWIYRGKSKYTALQVK